MKILELLFQRLCREYNRERKTTIILTSHYMEDILQLCERIVIINLGKIIYDGPIADLVEKYSLNKMITVYFENEIERKDVEKFGNVCKFDPIKVSIEVPRKQVKDVAGEILRSDLPVKDIDISEDDIDSIIRKIFEKKK